MLQRKKFSNAGKDWDIIADAEISLLRQKKLYRNTMEFFLHHFLKSLLCLELVFTPHAAIASFAFGLSYAVVDGNVERILARYFGISAPVGSSAGKKLYSAIARELLYEKDPGTYNQAIMDFGATICKPKHPLCTDCIQSKNCQAYQQGWTNKLPLKSSPPKRKTRWLYYFVVEAGQDKVWIRERTGKDIWQNLYEFVLMGIWENNTSGPHPANRLLP